MAPSDLGRISVFPAGGFEAGNYGELRFVYEVGESGVDAGGSVEIVFNTAYPTNSWSFPQICDASADGFVTVRTTGKAQVSVEVLPVPPVRRHCSLAVHVVRVNVGQPGLGPGDEVIVTVGEKAMGSRGTMAQYMARRLEFPVYVTPEVHQGKITSVCDWFKVLARIQPVRSVAHFLPSLEVRGGGAARLEVVGPSIVGVGEEFSVGVVALDRFWNKATRFGSGVRVELIEGSLKGLRKEYAFSEDGRSRVAGLRADKPCVCYLAAFDAESGAGGMSNPILVQEAPGPRLYWGEIHGHTELSDGNGTPEEHYEYARDVAMLDFAAITDHITHADGEANVAKWEISKKATEAFDAPGKFVTMHGYEPWFGPLDFRYAHANVYFPDASAPYIPMERPKEEVWAEVAKHGGMIVPHHTGYGRTGMRMKDWEAFRWERSPVVEVFSAHGNSEAYDAEKPLINKTEGAFVQDALARGLKLGFVGGSDYHQAFTGTRIRLGEFPANINACHFQYRCGYTGAWGDGLEREAIWNAMFGRRTYATSGGRMIITLKINGEQMGGTVRGGGVKMEAFAAGEGVLDRIEVVKNNEVIHVEEPGALWGSFELEDSAEGDENFYYLRVRQRDGELGWSSPIWVKG